MADRKIPQYKFNVETKEIRRNNTTLAQAALRKRFKKTFFSLVNRRFAYTGDITQQSKKQDRAHLNNESSTKT